MGTQLRFYYNRSVWYGWCVYDRLDHAPAYEACADLLPPVKQDENGTTTESPVMLRSEYAAMRLCSRLNRAHAKKVEELNKCRKQ